MTLHASVRDRLHAIEALLRETNHWQEQAPDRALSPASSRFAWTRSSRWNGYSGC